jgi:hypothetical protein
VVPPAVNWETATMSDTLDKRLRAATGAGWRVLLIWWLWLMIGWLGYLAIMHYRPGWVRHLWGGYKVTWEQIQEIYIWFFAVMKMGMFVWLLGVLFLVFLRRGLRRGSEALA